MTNSLPFLASLWLVVFAVVSWLVAVVTAALTAQQTRRPVEPPRLPGLAIACPVLIPFTWLWGCRLFVGWIFLGVFNVPWFHWI